MGSVVGLLPLNLLGCYTLPCLDVAGCCLGGPGHKVPGCRTLRGTGPSTNSTGQNQGPQATGTVAHPLTSTDLRLVVGYWQTELVSGIWLQAPELPETISDHCLGREGWFLTQLGMSPGCPRVFICLLVDKTSWFLCRVWLVVAVLSISCRVVVFWSLPADG